MGNLIDYTGARFGRLIVVRHVEPNGDRKARWLCKCDCGNEVVLRADSLRRGTKSCGCLRSEVARKTSTRHGKYFEPLHGVWNSMKQRCLNPNNKDYRYYGARGIRVCEAWKDSYLSFRNWAVNNGYKAGLTIDRKDTYGDYEPSNCRWITIQEQQKNRRSCLKYRNL